MSAGCTAMRDRRVAERRRNPADAPAFPLTVMTLQPSSLWVIEPAADPSDDYWQDRQIWARVVVSAPSPTLARLAAEQWALRKPVLHVGNETPSPRAGLTDAKLYHVRPASPSLAEEFRGSIVDNAVLRAEPLAPASLNLPV